MINPETVEKILDTARIEEVVGDFVNLKKRGVNMLGLCPFHNEKTPSFTVSPAKGIFKCFGCGKGGNAVNFIMEHEHSSYPEALKYLAAKYNIEVEEEMPSPEAQLVIDEKESLFNLTAFAQKYFEQTLHDTEEGKAIGLTYFKERGFSLEIIKKFGLGYSLNTWDSFTNEALKNGYKKEYLEKTSLAKHKVQQWYDAFRGRVIFPIHNLSGRPLGFGARTLLSDKKQPKYVNSAESEIYHKSNVLYGLFFAKTAIARLDNCYLTEGYTDVISLHQAGIENVIASSGTSLTTGQIKLIRRYTANITLLFDGDAAGIKAAFRGIDMILEEGMNVRVVLFPEGEDPDSYARKYRPVEVKEFIETHAADFITFKTNLLLGETQNDPIKKAGLIKEIAASIAIIPEPITRSLYVQKCGELLQVDEKLLFAEINKQMRSRIKERHPDPSPREEDEWIAQSTAPIEETLQPGVSLDHQEKEVIRLLLQYHHIQFDLEYKDEQGKPAFYPIVLRDYLLGEIRDDQLTFENTECQAIFDIFLQAMEEGTTPSAQFFFNHENAKIRQLAIDLLTSPYNLSENWEHKHGIYITQEENNLGKTAPGVLYAFKLKKVEKMIEEKQDMLKTEKDHNQVLHYMEQIRNLKTIRSTFAMELKRVIIQ